MPKNKGYGSTSGNPRPSGGSDKKGTGQFFHESTTKSNEGIGKSIKIKRNPSS